MQESKELTAIFTSTATVDAGREVEKLKLQIANYKFMKFSDEFEARFAEMLTHYPTKRSALVPTLLYAQDEVGSLTDEVIAELAERLDLTELEVRNVISYYSMLTTKPRGKYNVQVCTNIACMLRRRRRIAGALREETRHWAQGHHAGRIVFTGRSRMHRRMQLGSGGAGELRLS